MTADASQRLNNTAKSFFIIGCILALLYLASQFIMSVIFASFISLALMPLCQKLEGNKMRRIFSTIIVVVGISALFITIVSIIFMQIREFILDLPNLSQKIEVNFLAISHWLNQTFGITLSNNTQELTFGNFVKSEMGSFSQIFELITSIGLFILTVPIYIFFMLLYRDNFTAFLKAGAKSKQQIDDRMKIVTQIKYGVQSYLKGLGVVIFIVAILSSIAYLFIGLDYAILLGVTSALLTLVPYIGVYLGALIPAAVALLTKDSFWYPLAVLGACSLIQFIEGNFITPKVIGKNVDLNPLVVILSIIVMGALAGILGMIMAVPIVAAIKIGFDHTENMKPYSLLLGNKVSLRSKLIDGKQDKEVKDN